MLTLEQFNTLLVALYSGPQENPSWDTFLNLLCKLLPARITVISLTRPRPGNPGLTFIGGRHFDSVSRLQYANNYAALDPFVNLPDGEAVTLEDMLPLAKLRETAFYREHLYPTDTVQELGIDILRGGTVGIFLRAARGEKDDPFGEKEKALFNLLGPHLRQMLVWLDRDKHQHFERSLYEGTNRRLEVGTVLLDRTGGIVYCNPVARHRLNTSQHLRARNGKLVAVRSHDNRRLQTVILECIQAEENGPVLTQAIPMAGEQGADKLFVLVKPLQRETVSNESASDERDPEDIHGLHDREHSPRVAVYISAPEELTNEQQGILQQLFNFTPSEARVAISLANGLSLEEIGEVLGVTRNTARTHLFNAFQKARVSRQSALVSLVLRSLAGLG